jgi:hypothetical protein
MKKGGMTGRGRRKRRRRGRRRPRKQNTKLFFFMPSYKFGLELYSVDYCTI